MKVISIKQKISCQIITGFLGAGKTNYILDLLENKPKNERWAVLINEVGNTVYPIEYLEGKGVFIHEVYGGCLCCSAGLVFQTSLNRMIKKAQPDFILIEPAGYAHLNNIVSLLGGSYYKDILTMKPTICMVNALQLEDQKYHENSGYQYLIKSADSLALINSHDPELPQALSEKYDKPCISISLNGN